MEILKSYGKEEIAILNIAQTENGILEFVESIQPPIPREEKWVLIISTLYGCPMGCIMCDAGEYYHGKVSKAEMFSQIDHLIAKRFPNSRMLIPIPKLKIQFARMGEPTLNSDVLGVLKELPKKYNAPGLIPCISTVAPNNGANFLSDLINIKNDLYADGKFQLQFSIHSTNEEKRNDIIHDNIWSMNQIKKFGDKWLEKGDRKITLNFAVAESFQINPDIIARIFPPSDYFIKITPINPTNKAIKTGLKSAITSENEGQFKLVEDFKSLGYETLLSIGEWEENQIGSNCGQFATKFIDGAVKLKDNYNCENFLL